jgi:hypothetical protein
MLAMKLQLGARGMTAFSVERGVVLQASSLKAERMPIGGWLGLKRGVGGRAGALLFAVHVVTCGEQ